MVARIIELADVRARRSGIAQRAGSARGHSRLDRALPLLDRRFGQPLRPHRLQPARVPAASPGNYVLVRRDADGRRTVLSIGRVTHDAPSLNLAEIRQRGAELGANEVHVHLLADTPSTASSSSSICAPARLDRCERRARQRHLALSGRCLQAPLNRRQSRSRARVGSRSAAAREPHRVRAVPLRPRASKPQRALGRAGLPRARRRAANAAHQRQQPLELALADAELAEMGAACSRDSRCCCRPCPRAPRMSGACSASDSGRRSSDARARRGRSSAMHRLPRPCRASVTGTSASR